MSPKWHLSDAVVGEAAERFVAMREQEADRLEDQLSEELGRVESFLDELEPELDDIRTRILDRLRDRMETAARRRCPDRT